MFNVPKGVKLGSWWIGRQNNSGTLVGPPCGMMNGGMIKESLQYGWSTGLVNMPISKGFAFPGGTQIEVSMGNCQKNIGRS